MAEVTSLLTKDKDDNALDEDEDLGRRPSQRTTYHTS